MMFLDGLELLKINPTTLYEVNTTTLHSFLQSKQGYNNWITNRIENYGYIENEDYQIELVPTKGRPKKVYHVTVGVGKELALVENTEKGRTIRKYFIKIEQEYREQNKPLLIDGKDPRCIIGGHQSTNNNLRKQNETLKGIINDLVEKNATLSLPTPKEDIEIYKKFITQLQEAKNKSDARGDFFESQSANMLTKFKSRDKMLNVVKSFQGQFLDAPKVYKELEKVITEMERVA